MGARQLHEVLDGIRDTGEVVIRRPGCDGGDELAAAWRLAHSEASAALDEWRRLGTRAAFSVFRAAEDRADAAQDALAAR